MSFHQYEVYLDKPGTVRGFGTFATAEKFARRRATTEDYGGFGDIVIWHQGRHVASVAVDGAGRVWTDFSPEATQAEMNGAAR